jgi:hypothetical protein
VTVSADERSVRVRWRMPMIGGVGTRIGKFEHVEK